MVVAQLVRASVCGTEGRGFEPLQPPSRDDLEISCLFFLIIYVSKNKQNFLSVRNLIKVGRIIMCN